MQIKSYSFTIESQQSFQMLDLTNQINQFLGLTGMQQGLLVVMSQHTTTALVINEMEDRLVQDVKNFFSDLIPSHKKYLHNDIHLRDCPSDEPKNAHSHIISMLLHQTESVAIVDGALSLGKWQSIILLELDGPRTRQIRLQFIGN